MSSALVPREVVPPVARETCCRCSGSGVCGGCAGRGYVETKAEARCYFCGAGASHLRVQWVELAGTKLARSRSEPACFDCYSVVVPPLP